VLELTDIAWKKEEEIVVNWLAMCGVEAVFPESKV
jgi:hypothetical protein